MVADEGDRKEQAVGGEMNNNATIEHLKMTTAALEEKDVDSEGRQPSSATEDIKAIAPDDTAAATSGLDRTTSVLFREDTKRDDGPNKSNDSHGLDLERLESYRTPLSRMQIISIMLPLAAGVFIASLDITIIVTALPEIAAHFESSQIYTWTGGSYALAHASTTTLWSMLSDIWGRKPILFCALAAFFAGSTICAFDDNVKAFITGRAIQGAGAGGLTTMANICISDAFSLRERGLYFGILSVVMAFAVGIGPSVGGVFTERLSWQWCFYINMPISGLAFVLLWISYSPQNPKTPIWEGLKAIDWAGTALMAGGTLMFLLGLTFGGVEHPWKSLTVIALIVAGLVVIGLFLLTEWKLAKYPMVPLGIFGSRTSAASFSVCFSHGIVFMGLGFYLPLYFQAVLATGPLMAGVYILPFVISIAGTAACTGIYIQRSGKYILAVYAGLAITILGCGLMIDLPQPYVWLKIILYQVAAGVGLGINFEPALISLQAATHPDDIAAATSTFAFVRSISTAISIVIGGVVFQNQMQNKANSLIESLGLDGYSQYQGSDVLANIYTIDTLPQYQQLVIRTAVHESLRGVWIMYTAFAGLGAIAGAFVAVHPLTNVHKRVPLGLPAKQESFSRRQSQIAQDKHSPGSNSQAVARTKRKQPPQKRSRSELTTAQIHGLELVYKKGHWGQRFTSEKSNGANGHSTKPAPGPGRKSGPNISELREPEYSTAVFATPASVPIQSEQMASSFTPTSSATRQSLDASQHRFDDYTDAGATPFGWDVGDGRRASLRRASMDASLAAQKSLRGSIIGSVRSTRSTIRDVKGPQPERQNDFTQFGERSTDALDQLNDQDDPAVTLSKAVSIVPELQQASNDGNEGCGGHTRPSTASRPNRAEEPGQEAIGSDEEARGRDVVFHEEDNSQIHKSKDTS